MASTNFGPKLHIIGLCGLVNVGKDTAGEILAAHGGFRPMSFAAPLKAEAAEAFGVETLIFVRREYKEQPRPELALSHSTDKAFQAMALLYLTVKEPHVPRAEHMEKPRSPRQIMQLWGTEYRRALEPNYWARQVAMHIRCLMEGCHERRFVVTDVRFRNEVETLRNMGGRIWQIRRPGIDHMTTADAGHESANDGSAFEPNAVINNSHDVKHLRNLVLGEFWALDAGLRRVEVHIPCEA